MTKFGYKTTINSQNLNNIKSMLSLFSSNVDIVSKLLNYLNNDKGIEKFQTSPIEKSNWSENKNTI